MSKLRKLLKSDQGISLIEVVASIVIIGVILISFFGLFVQSSKTGKTSETIIDATYTAQLEMENVYQLSKTETYANLEEGLKRSNYTISPSNINEYTKVEGPYIISLSFFPGQDTKQNLKNVVVTVYEDGVKRSQMENIYKWR